MKKTILSLLICFVSFMLFGQAPSFHWAAGLGGGGVNIGYSIATDASGNVYTTGSFSGTVDFDPGPGTYTLASSGSSDIFISKLNSTGAFVWAQKIGGTGTGAGNSIALDASANVYITGFFIGTSDFDPGVNTFNLSSAGSEDVFVCKLNSAGGFVWAQRMGGGAPEIGQAIDVDASGNVYTTGFFQGSGDYNPGAGIFILSPAGGADIFISKLDVNGAFVWAQQISATGTGSGKSIKVDALGNVYTSGFFSYVADFDPGPGTFLITSAGSTDIYVNKLNSSGGFIWAKQMGGAFIDNCTSVSVDATGNVFVTGSFQNTADFDPGVAVFNLTSLGSNDIFVTKLDASGTFSWAKQLGSTNDDSGQSTKVDASGNIYITGYFNGTVDFDPGPGTNSLTSAGADDAFICKLSAAGNFAWALNFGGIDTDVSKSITVDSGDNVYSTGYFASISDMDPGAGTYTLLASGNTDVFVQKLCPMPSPPVNITPVINQNVCDGQTTTLTATSSGSVNWFASPTGTNVLGTGNSFVTPTLSTGNYTFYAEAYTCFANPVRTPISLTVTLLPVFSVSTNIALLCKGQTATLTASGVTNCTWSPGGVGTSVVVSPTVTTTFTAYGSNGPGCVKPVLLTQTVSDCTELEESSIDNLAVSVFPNPVTNELSFINNFNSDFEISIYDSQSKLIFSKKVMLNEGVIKLDTSKYPSGIYHLKFIELNRAYVVKVVVVKD